MLNKVIESMKNNYVIPSILITSYKKIKLTEQEVIFIIYLINMKNLEFNPQELAKDLDMDINDLLKIIGDLNNKDLLNIDHIVENKVHREIINLELLYNKLGFIIVNDNVKETKDKNLYDLFEKEFGRTLSPMEYEIINAWTDNYSKEIIMEALKEAVYNNVSNLRYIDKILSEWNKKGIKNIKDIENDKKNYINNKKNKKELFEYDWLNNNE